MVPQNTTFLCGASAAGIAFPPMIVHPTAFIDGTVYAKGESGWVGSKLLYTWIKKCTYVT